MNIGILTFYKVANFGANLQAISTYLFLKSKGHNPILIFYESQQAELDFEYSLISQEQKKEHLKTIDGLLYQTKKCRTASDINEEIERNKIEAIIIGSDAVMQHHPLLSRIYKGRRKPFYVAKVTPERMFPNPFWGVGLSSQIPKILMSVSSQNSKYKLFSQKTTNAMKKALTQMKYISVRDSWTQKMIYQIIGKEVEITPDPVFALNQNAITLIPTEISIRNKFNLPKHYVLISLHSQSLSKSQLSELKTKLYKLNLIPVAFPMPKGILFEHDFDYQIDLPLNPFDWYALIRYSSAYIGSNMHPIVVSLHNAVPCFSIDNWGTRNFWGKTVLDGSSKVQDILTVFGVSDNHASIENGVCHVDTQFIIDKIIKFPKEKVKEKAMTYLKMYNEMMSKILYSIVN